MKLSDWLTLSFDERVKTLNESAHYSDAILMHEIEIRFDEWCEENPIIKEWIVGVNHGSVDFRIYCEKHTHGEAPKFFLDMPLSLYDISEYPKDETTANEHGCTLFLVVFILCLGLGAWWFLR